MANRFPLVVDTADSNKIKEIPTGDNLQLSGNSIIGVVNITGSGTLTIDSISATNITKGGTALATVATSGSYADLSNKPTNISLFTNDVGYVVTGSNVSNLNNDAGYLTTVAFSAVTSKPTTLSGYGITDAATSAQGTKADSAIQPGSNVSTLNNDAGYITVAQIQAGDLTVDVNNSGDLIGSVFGQDSTILIDGVLSAINTDGTIRSHTTPHVSGTYDLGSFTNRFRDAYINGQVKTTNIYSQDDADLTIAGASVDSPGNGNDIIIVAGANTQAGGIGGNVRIDGGLASLGTKGYVYIGTQATGSGVQIGSASNGVQVELNGDILFLPDATVNFQNVPVTNLNVTDTIDGDISGSVFADDSTLLVDAVNGVIPGYVKIADLKTALQDGAGDYAAFKAWVIANL